MNGKAQLLRDLIAKQCAQTVAIANAFPLAYQEDLIGFLAEQLRPVFWHVHSSTEIQNHLKEIFPLIIPALLANIQKHGFYKFDDAKKQAVSKAIAAKLATINLQYQPKLALIENGSQAFLYLQQQDYLLFLQAIDQLLRELNATKSKSQQLKELIALLSNLNLSSQDNQNLQAFIAALGDEILEHTELSKHFYNLSMVKVAFDEALRLRDDAAEEPLRVQQETEESDHEKLARQYRIKSIKQIFYAQSFNRNAAQIFIKDLMAFIDSSDIKRDIEIHKLRKKLKQFCESHCFFGISFSNYEIVKDYVLKNIPAAQAGFFAQEWKFLFTKIVEESLGFITHNLNKIALNKTHESVPAGIDIAKGMLDAGGVNSIYPALIRMSNGSARQIIYRISRLELCEGEANVLDEIYAAPHPTIIKRYYTATYKIPAEELQGNIDYIEYAPCGEITDYPINQRQLPKLFYAIVDGVRFLHDLNIAHLDLKPKNILLGDDGIPRIIDFDLARYNSTKVKKLAGTPDYWPPEVFATEDHTELNYLAFDVWALGVTLYELYTGRLPPFANNEFINFEQMELHAPFFHKNMQGDFINTDAVLVAEVIQKLLVTDPKKRLKNFKEINKLAYFEEINPNKIYEELSENNRLTFLRTELEQEEVQKLQNKKPQSSNVAKNALTLREKISCYQNIISRYEEVTVELTVDEEEYVQAHNRIFIESNPKTAAKHNFNEIKNKAAEKKKNKMLAYKKQQHEQALNILKEELVQLQKGEAEEIVRQKMPQYADFICERMAQVSILVADNARFKPIWKQIKKEIRAVKKDYRIKHNLPGWQQIGSIIEKYNHILRDENEKSLLKRLLTANELLAHILSLPDFKTNDVLKNLFLRTNEEIKRLRQANPLIIVDPAKVSLTPTYYHQREITIPAAAIPQQLNKSSIPSSEEWQKLTTRYYKVISFLAKRRLESLRNIDRLIKGYTKAETVENRIDVALQLIVACQQWLDDKHNISKRDAVLQLQSTALAELNWLLGQAISLGIDLDKQPVANEQAKLNDLSKQSHNDTDKNRNYLAKIFRWPSVAKAKIRNIGSKNNQNQSSQEVVEDIRANNKPKLF